MGAGRGGLARHASVLAPKLVGMPFAALPGLVLSVAMDLLLI